MFGHYFNKQTYENLPSAEFLLGMVLFCLGFIVELTITASLTALAGLVFMALGFVTVGLRNRHRGRDFQFGQLLDFYRVKEEKKGRPRLERDLYEKHSTRGSRWKLQAASRKLQGLRAPAPIPPVQKD